MQAWNASRVLKGLDPLPELAYFVGAGELPSVEGVEVVERSVPPQMFEDVTPDAILIEFGQTTPETNNAWLSYAADAVRFWRNDVIRVVLEMRHRTVVLLPMGSEIIARIKNEGPFSIITVSRSQWAPLNSVQDAVRLYRQWKRDDNEKWLSLTFPAHPIVRNMFKRLVVDRDARTIAGIAAELTAYSSEKRLIEDVLNKLIFEGGAGEPLHLQVGASAATAGKTLGNLIAKRAAHLARRPPPLEVPRELRERHDPRPPVGGIGISSLERELYYDSINREIVKQEGIRALRPFPKGSTWLVRGEVKTRLIDVDGKHVKVTGRPSGRIRSYYVQNEGHWTASIQHAPTGPVDRLSRAAVRAFANLALNDLGELRALRDIKNGEKVYFDYGSDFFPPGSRAFPFLDLNEVRGGARVTLVDQKELMKAMITHVWDPVEAERIGLVDLFLAQLADGGPIFGSLPISAYLDFKKDNVRLRVWDGRVEAAEAAARTRRSPSMDRALGIEDDEGFPDPPHTGELWSAAVRRYDAAVRAVESIEDEDLRSAARQVLKLAGDNPELRVTNPNPNVSSRELGNTYVPEVSANSVLAAAKEIRAKDVEPAELAISDSVVDEVERDAYKIGRLMRFIAESISAEVTALDPRDQFHVLITFQTINDRLPEEITRGAEFAARLALLVQKWDTAIVDGNTTASYGDAVQGALDLMLAYAQYFRAVSPLEFERFKPFLGGVVVPEIASPARGQVSAAGEDVEKEIATLRALAWSDCTGAPGYTEPTIYAAVRRVFVQTNSFRPAYLLYNSGCEVLAEAIEMYVGASVWVHHMEQAIALRPGASGKIRYVSSLGEIEDEITHFVVLHPHSLESFDEVKAWFSVVVKKQRGRIVNLIASDEVRRAIAPEATRIPKIDPAPLVMRNGHVLVLNVYEMVDKLVL